MPPISENPPFLPPGEGRIEGEAATATTTPGSRSPATGRGQSFIARAIFLRSLGVIYLIAFLSLWVQIDGLVGSDGILPAKLFLASARLQTPGNSAVSLFLSTPTLCWISSSDAFLHFLCAGGAVLACMLIAGLAPVPVLFLLWLFYLSLVKVGQDFLGFQWDILLLETGFLAIFVAPLTLRLQPSLLRTQKNLIMPWAQRSAAPDSDAKTRLAKTSPVALFLLRWLLFRLIFLSGLVKLTSGDVTWRSFTAMRYHYFTQPLPTWTSWYAHLAPGWFQTFSVAGVFFFELVIPPFFFAPGRMRVIACAAAAFLQLLILATGNFGFFNLLTLVLCVTLLDDAFWRRLRIRPAVEATLVKPIAGRRRPVAIAGTVFAGIFVLLSLVPALFRVGMTDVVPGPMLRAYIAVAPFVTINAYGLFASMTTERPELIVEGSADGTHWLPYEFKWKPGDVHRRPQFCAPHMPRLDWQMWFAALNLYYNGSADNWLWNFALRLHEGSPAVLKLLKTNPFPDHPPAYVRMVLYDYRFTTRAERAATGPWWTRRRLGVLPMSVSDPPPISPAGR